MPPLRSAGNIAAAHEAIAAAVPERDCIVHGPRTWTWAETTSRTRRFAHALGELGVGGSVDHDVPGWVSPHDHVALYLTNGVEYLEAMLGSWKARVAPINVNYRYTERELGQVLGPARPRAIVVHRRFGPVLALALDELAHSVADWTAPTVITVDDGSDAARIAGTIGYEDFLAGGSDAPIELDWPDDDRYVVFTGGTTGAPKGVLWRQGDFLATALGIDRPLPDLVARARRPDRTRTLPAPPFMHGAAHWNALSAWLGGGTVVIQSDTDRLDPDDLIDTCRAHDVTALLLVGDAFARPLLDALERRAGVELPSLRFLVSGGAVLSPSIRRRLLQRLPDVTVLDLLGSSESGNHGSARRQRGDDDAPGARFAPGAATAIVDDARRRFVPPGSPEEGWLATTGRVPMGYLDDPETTAATFPVIDGRRCSVAGDRARWTASGEIELLGRGSVTINSGGEKIHAEEVEMALKNHPNVYDTLVVGVPDPRWGQRVVAVVSAVDRTAFDPDDVAREAATLLARYKLPKDYLVVDTVARSASGKPDYSWARDVAVRHVDERMG